MRHRFEEAFTECVSMVIARYDMTQYGDVYLDVNAGAPIESWTVKIAFCPRSENTPHSWTKLHEIAMRAATITRKLQSMIGLLSEIWIESSRREKQNLALALLAIVVAITGGLSWVFWHKAWIAVGLVVLANVIAKPLFDELEDIDRYR